MSASEHMPEYPWRIGKVMRSGTTTIVDANNMVLAVVMNGGEEVAKQIIELCNLCNYEKTKDG